MEAEAQAPADERSLKEAAHIIPLPELVARISCNQRVKPGISVKPSGRFENEARHLNTAWWPKNFTQNNHRSRDGHLRRRIGLRFLLGYPRTRLVGFDRTSVTC